MGGMQAKKQPEYKKEMVMAWKHETKCKRIHVKISRVKLVRAHFHRAV